MVNAFRRETAICLIIRGSLEPGHVRELCERGGVLFDDLEAGAVMCDVGGLQPDAVAVEALARLQLLARRSGRDLILRGAESDLRELIAFMGLSDVLPVES